MSDITMCSGDGCDLKLKCHRYTANSSGWQSFFSVPPIKDAKCEMYWSNDSQQIYLNIKDILSGNLK
jgi:hypothetical protein